MKRKYESLKPLNEVTVWSSMLSDSTKSEYNEEATFKCFLTEDNFAVFVPTSLIGRLGKLGINPEDVTYVHIERKLFIIAVLMCFIYEDTKAELGETMDSLVDYGELMGEIYQCREIDEFIFYVMNLEITPLDKPWLYSMPYIAGPTSPYVRKEYLLNGWVSVDVDEPATPISVKKKIFWAGFEMLKNPELYEEKMKDISYLRYTVIDLAQMPGFGGIAEFMNVFLMEKCGIDFRNTSFCVAGSSVLAGVLKYMNKTFMSGDRSFKPGDIDVFVHPMNEEDVEKIAQQHWIIRDTLRGMPASTTITNLFQVAEPVIGIKKHISDTLWVQFIPVTNKTPFRIIQEFDIAPCQIAFFRGKVYITAHAYYAVQTGKYYVPEKAAPNRVEKYHSRGFEARNIHRYVFLNRNNHEIGRPLMSLVGEVLGDVSISEIRTLEPDTEFTRKIGEEKSFRDIEDGGYLQERNYTAHSCQRFWFNKYFKSLLKKN